MSQKVYKAKLSSAKVYPIMGSECGNTGTRITTLVCEYPRAIHAQLLTHRVFTKNSSSTRAVPLKAAIEQIDNNPAEFIWTANESGMQGNQIHDQELLGKIKTIRNNLWLATKQAVLQLGSPAKDGGLGVHKQNAGRFLEPFQNIRICLTSTEWDNWDWLRIDGAAQGEIEELASLMKQARDEMDYPVIGAGEWHLPFIDRRILSTGVFYYHPESGENMELEDAKELSMSICAQTSYRKEDYSEGKTSTVIGRLFTGKKIHASPSEHQATPIPFFDGMHNEPANWPVGVTAMDRNYALWSGNFKHWIQNRQLIPNHDKAKY